MLILSSINDLRVLKTVEIIELLEDCIYVNFQKELNYKELIDRLANDLENQNKLCNYVLDKDLSNKDSYSILVILTELYNNQSDEQYNLSFELLYDWLLKKMFSKDLYDYSICYKFSRILVKIINNYRTVYSDIINSIKEDDQITVQIAICSTYSLTKEFFKYKDLTNLFIGKIFRSLQLNNNTQVIKDFKHFMIQSLINFGYVLTDIDPFIELYE